ncbi:MAG: hypothetical protein MI741_15065, partial [Rhodospirillales bacterium]|nr:hypothetical protein [Rhodospirillales bacterium]
AADQFALGALFYRVLTGHAPFSSAWDTLHSDGPAPLEGVDPVLSRTVARMMTRTATCVPSASTVSGGWLN